MVKNKMLDQLENKFNNKLLEFMLEPFYTKGLS